MKVEIWSDVVCPWCYVGKRNFEAALATFAHADEVDVEWKAYELDRHAPRERSGDYVSRLSAKYGVGRDDAQAMIDRIVTAAAGAGIEMRFDRSRPGNTFDAHRVLHLAKKQGVQDAVAERLFVATFVEGRPIGDPEALAAVAVDAGLAEGDVCALLSSDQFADEVRADEEEAAEIGVRGVPFFVFDRRYGVSGAQPPEAFRQVLARTWREANPIEVIAAGDAGICDDDNCPI